MINFNNSYINLFLCKNTESMGHSIWMALLIGRNKFRTSKLKTLLKLTLSRLGILKNKHRCRFSNAKSDVAQLLSFGYSDQAIDRVCSRSLPFLPRKPSFLISN